MPVLPRLGILEDISDDHEARLLAIEERLGLRSRWPAAIQEVTELLTERHAPKHVVAAVSSILARHAEPVPHARPARPPLRT